MNNFKAPVTKILFAENLLLMKGIQVPWVAQFFRVSTLLLGLCRLGFSDSWNNGMDKVSSHHLGL